MLVPFKIPPGVVDRGTEYETTGRFYRANQVRWRDGVLQPMGGWTTALASGSITGTPRAMHSWVTNSGAKWTAIATDQKLYVYKGGKVWDITPVGYTVGRPDATGSSGFGVGPFGNGAFGTPRSVAVGVDATTWHLDNWGENLLAVATHEGTIYEWSLNTASPAVAVANAPSAKAILSTEERILLAIGASGNPRRVAYSDQEDNTDWTATATNKAGGRNLDTDGALLGGVAVRGGYLLVSTTDAHLFQYAGGPLVWNSTRLGAHGAISGKAIATFEGQAAWMGDQAFWVYNGGRVQQLDCDLAEYVWGDINLNLRSMFHAGTLAEYGEVYFFYASAGATDIDRYVVWCWEEGWWSMGQLARTAWNDRGSVGHPLAVAADGTVYEHESGWTAAGTTRAGVVFASSGPVEVGEGDNALWINRVLPDEKIEGQVTLTFRSRFTPNGTEVTKGPYTLEPYVPVRVAGRQVAVDIYQAVDADWRVGKFRFDAQLSGGR